MTLNELAMKAGESIPLSLATFSSLINEFLLIKTWLFAACSTSIYVIMNVLNWMEPFNPSFVYCLSINVGYITLNTGFAEGLSHLIKI